MDHSQYDEVATPRDTVEGVVKRVSLPDHEGYVRGAVSSGDRIVYFSGAFPNLDVGARVTLTGELDDEGRRIAAYACTAYRSKEAALAQLIQSQVKGIGPSRAARLADTPADSVLGMLYSSEWWSALHVKKQAFPFPSRDRLEGLLHLYMLGYPVRLLPKLDNLYKAGASVRPRTAPYGFVMDRHVSFYIEDLVQRQLGTNDEEMRTCAAGVALSDWIESDMEGSTIFPLPLLVDRLRTIMRVDHAQKVKALFSEYLSNTAFYQVRGMWGPTALVTAEVRVASRVHEEHASLEVPADLNLDGLDTQQKTAVRTAFSQRFSVITGGPGTGKTTTIRTIVREATMRNFNVRLLAPTGKAARRMSDVAGMAASTIHRYLPRDKDAALPCADDLIIVDEASMVDAALMGALLEYTPKAQIVCVGDANQLPSVGPGAILEDLVNSTNVHVTKLNTIHRSAQASWMVQHAPHILNGEISLQGSHDFQFTEVKPGGLAEACLDRLKRYPECQILSPRRTGPLGTDALNAKIQRALHDEKEPHTTYSDYLFYVGDPVVATVNDYRAQVYNGDTGTVVEVSPNSIAVQYKTYKGGQTVEYVGSALSSVQPAYVLSVHRFQGSEASRVVVLCHSQMGPTILTRRLMYTAVTRAKEYLEIVGDRLGVRMAVTTQTRPRRTALGTFLADPASWPERAKEIL